MTKSKLAGPAHRDFVDRLRERVGLVQRREPENISVAQAAKSMGIPETTLRSTLEGRYPRSEAYWRALRTYCRVDLDWLICGLGEPPEPVREGHRRESILVVDNDRHKRELIKMSLQDYSIDLAWNLKEALELMRRQAYDLVITGDGLDWNDEALNLFKRKKSRPRLVLIANDSLHLYSPCRTMADGIVAGSIMAEEIIKVVTDQLDQ